MSRRFSGRPCDEASGAERRVVWLRAMPVSRRRAALAAGLLAVVVVGTVAAVTHATAPAQDGRIAFIRFHLSSMLWSEVYVVGADGTGERKVTHPPRGWRDIDPDWAPDGSRIVFARRPPNPDRPDKIWSVKPDGSDATRLTPACVSCWPEDNYPAFSPDGHRIAFVRFYGGPAPLDRLMVADSNLQHPHGVFSFGIGSFTPNLGCPSWSPNGRRLAFYRANVNSRRYKPVNGQAIFTVGVDGRGLHQVTPWRLRAGCEGLDWSPNGTRILFRTEPHQPNNDSGGNLYTIRPDGTGLRQLTHFNPRDEAPGALRGGSYAPDGNSIVFATYHGAVILGRDAEHPDVFVMAADGTDMRPVTRNPEFESDPDWGPR